MRHILLVKTRSEATANQLATAKQAFFDVIDRIEGLEAVEWGVNNSPEGKNAGYDLCIQMTFENEEARDRYLPHTAHDRLKIDFTPIIDDILVFDYNPENTAQ